MLNAMTVMIGFYLLAQLVLAWWIARGVKTESDFLVAGRSIGLVLGMLSLFATNFGAESVVGASAAVADEGLAGARADPFGYTLCWLLMALLVAYPLRRRAYTTINDFFRDRYGRSIEMLVTVVVLPTSLIWAAAQMMAFGQIIAVVSDVPVATGIIAATAVVTIYTFLGGMKSDIWTDAVQAVVLIVGMALLAVMVMQAAGGFAQSIDRIDRAALSFTAPGESFWARLDVWMIPVLGSLVMQEAVGRLLSMKTARIARNACVVAALMYLVIGCIPVYIGLVGAQLPGGENLAHRDAFLPEMASSLMPAWAYVIFIGALVSAIISTVNSTLLAFAALATKNLVLPLRPHMGDSTQLKLSRGLLLLAGPLTCALALSGDTIFEMAQLSSSFGSAGVLVTFFGGLWFARGGAYTAAAALITGLAVSILGHFVYSDVWVAPFLTSIAAAALVYALGTFLERGRTLPSLTASESDETAKSAPA